MRYHHPNELALIFGKDRPKRYAVEYPNIRLIPGLKLREEDRVNRVIIEYFWITINAFSLLLYKRKLTIKAWTNNNPHKLIEGE